MAVHPRLHVVTGKGGVGKSTVSCAIALASAARGARTLAIEIPERAGLSRIFGVSPAVAGAEADAGPHLTCTYINGAEALTEYLTRVVRLGPLRSLVLEHPLYQAFIRAAPGVQELMAVGKVRDEFRRRTGTRHHWDTIVVDAGASGHSLQLLRMPAAAANAFGSGRVHGEASRIDQLLRDPARCVVHVVATPEEMPLREAETVVEALRERLDMPLGTVFVNQCRPPLPEGIDGGLAALEQLDIADDEQSARDALVSCTARAIAWSRIQEQGIADLERRCGLRVVRLPRLAIADDDRAHATELIPHVREVLA